MSDGMTDGYRAAREHEARQKMVDAFFEIVLDHVERPRSARKDLRGAFDAFDAIRYGDTLLHGRLMKERGKRWEAFIDTLADAAGKRSDAAVIKAWAEILALALRFASQDVTGRLQAVSAFKAYRIALFVPNGTGFYGKNDPTLLGDFAGALDALALTTARPDAYATVIEEPGRAIVGVRQGVSGTEREVLEEERAKLRFLAVKAP